MKKITILILVYSIFLTQGITQTFKEEYSLEQIIKLAQEQSPDAIKAKHMFRANYWQMRTYKAEFLPKVSLIGTLPKFSREIIPQFDDGQEQYFDYNQLATNANISLTQNLGLTGGTFFVNSGLNRLDNFNLDTTYYSSVPISIGYRQNINGYNELKWKKKIEPLKYEEAKMNYIKNMEDVAYKAVNYFFSLALAQRNLEIAKVNYSNTDTLYKIAQGRYQIGTIAENELLQMELSNLNAGIALNNANLDLEVRKFQLRSFLGFNDNVDIQLIIPQEVRSIDVNVQLALEEAKANSPEIFSFTRQLLEAEQEVARTKAEKGLNIDFYASFGLNQTGADLGSLYQKPLNQQSVNLGVVLPILDWGLAKGKYKMAKSNQEVVKTTIDQAKTDFEQQIFLKVMQFNMQDDQVNIARKAEQIALSRYNVTKQRFLIGKINVLELNDSQTSKDRANTQYISALHNYWTYFYDLRKLTLYDFLKNEKITHDFTKLID